MPRAEVKVMVQIPPGTVQPLWLWLSEGDGHGVKTNQPPEPQFPPL